MVPGEPTLARQVFERGYKDLKSENLKSEVCFDTWPTECVINFWRFRSLISVLPCWKCGRLLSRITVCWRMNKVEGMMPIVTKNRHIDQETGQMVKGLSTTFTCSPLFLTWVPCSSSFSDWDLVFSDWDLVFADEG